MRNIIIAIVALFCTTNGYAQITLSPDAQYSLLTCEPSSELYTVFGHTALRLQDEANNIDLIFHWGVFDYATPHFATRFMLGTNNYEMGIAPSDFFMIEYMSRGSAVHEQAVALTQPEKQLLWLRLLENYQPENRQYLYNFIYDNCATRALHIILSSINPSDSIIHQPYKTDLTFRKQIHEHVNQGSFLGLAIDLIIGADADKPIDLLHAAAFPKYTMQALDHISTVRNGTTAPLVTSTSFAVKETHDVDATRMLSFKIQAKLNIILPILLIVLIIAMYLRNRTRAVQIIATTLFAISGLISLLILFLSFISSHPLVSENYNILWLNPINIILAVIINLNTATKVKRLTAIASLTTSLLYIIPIALQIQCATPQMLAWYATLATTLIITILQNKSCKNSSQSQY